MKIKRERKILVILGPTAVGKSTLAVKLARKFNGEIISADSRQVYRGLDIGTGKITTQEMQGVQHNLLDVADPKKQYSVAQYVPEARAAIGAIAARGKLPIIVGGTGFYISALLGGESIPDVPPNPMLRRKLSKKSASELFKALQKLDPKRAKHIDRYNSRRLIRAIEVAKALGRVPKISELPDYQPLQIGITMPKEKLKRRIQTRLIKRLANGMIAEAKKLHTRGLSWKRMEELGLEYRYLAAYLQKEISKDEMVTKLETEIWRYAKRQMTWFRRNKNIHWFKPTEYIKIGKSILKFSRI